MKRFIDCIIPFRTCNLRCEYCYITHTKSWNQKLPLFQYNADHIGCSLSVSRLGGTCLLNICGEGETLLPSEIVGIIHSILENGHYLMVVTNGTLSRRFDEIAELPVHCRNRLLIKFSFHYLELKRKNWIDVFFANVEKVRDAGCSISIELTPSDEMIPFIDEAISLCKKRTGAVCHVTVARDERNPSFSILSGHTKTEYEAIWGKFQSDLFSFKMRVFGKQRTEYCYAGLWSGVLTLTTGELKQCYRGDILQNIFEDIDSPIEFAPVGCRCMEPYCYNAHAFMTLGIVPSIRTPGLAEMRNRLCTDGSEWLTPDMKTFLNRKLIDDNMELTWFEKQLYASRSLTGLARMIHKSRSLFSSMRHKTIII